MNDDSIAMHMYWHVLSVLLTGQKKTKKKKKKKKKGKKKQKKKKKTRALSERTKRRMICQETIHYNALSETRKERKSAFEVWL